jgi:hypothetical protein
MSRQFLKLEPGTLRTRKADPGTRFYHCPWDPPGDIRADGRRCATPHPMQTGSTRDENSPAVETAQLIGAKSRGARFGSEGLEIGGFILARRDHSAQKHSTASLKHNSAGPSPLHQLCAARYVRCPGSTKPDSHIHSVVVAGATFPLLLGAVHLIVGFLLFEVDLLLVANLLIAVSKMPSSLPIA